MENSGKRLIWLQNKHRELDHRIQELDDSSAPYRGTKHEEMIKQLKRQKLALRDEIESLGNELTNNS